MAVPERVELPEGHPHASWSVSSCRSGQRRRSPHTVRGYGDDLAGLAAAHTGGVGEITVAVPRDWLAPLYSR